jgi:hypothetical protein
MIKIVRLVTGEEIIGYVENSGMFNYKISRPMLIVQGSFANYEVAMKLTDYLLFSSDTSIKIPTKSVITQYKPLESFEKYYITYIDYNDRVTKTSIKEHATYAVSELKYIMEEEAKTKDSFNELLVKYGKNKKLN